jgi:hypothetical protein
VEGASQQEDDELISTSNYTIINSNMELCLLAALLLPALLPTTLIPRMPRSFPFFSRKELIILYLKNGLASPTTR